MKTESKGLLRQLSIPVIRYKKQDTNLSARILFRYLSLVIYSVKTFLGANMRMAFRSFSPSEPARSRISFWLPSR